MSIDEAIAHAKEEAELQRKYAKEIRERTREAYLDYGEAEEQCAEEHEQLAEWLEELKSYRTSVFSGDMTQKMLKEEYCKAVDDFAERLKAGEK